MSQKSVLECQDCGEVIRRLSDSEAQQVAGAPYNFVRYCRSCAEDREAEGNYEIDKAYR